MLENILQAEDLSKIYEHGKNIETDVLKQIHLSVKQGEFVSIMGPSGSGKSTLLYHLSGMNKVTSGTVSFNGRNLVNLNEKELARLRLHDMGFVFQNHYLLKNLTIFENIILPGYHAKKQSRKQIENRAMDLMGKMGIEELADHDITQVSGGQLQRATICRALINNPAIVFADEPTGALNTAAANEVLDILMEINKLGTTILLVTHDVKVAAKSGRVLYMMDGRLIGEKKLDNKINKEELLFDWLTEKAF